MKLLVVFPYREYNCLNCLNSGLDKCVCASACFSIVKHQDESDGVEQYAFGFQGWRVCKTLEVTKFYDRVGAPCLSMADYSTCVPLDIKAFWKMGLCDWRWIKASDVNRETG